MSTVEPHYNSGCLLPENMWLYVIKLCRVYGLERGGYNDEVAALQSDCYTEVPLYIQCTCRSACAGTRMVSPRFGRDWL